MIYDLLRDQIAEDDSGIFGTLRNEEGEPLCETFELPWNDNIAERSCIPRGLYRAEVVVTQKFGRCVYIHDVPDRTDILIHTGNTATDTRGCILVGNYRQYAGVRDSRTCMGYLLIDLPDKFSLRVEGIR